MTNALIAMNTDMNVVLNSYGFCFNSIHIFLAQDSFLAEQRNALVQLADERRVLAEDRSQLTRNQRMATEKGQEESLKQSQGSARYEGRLALIVLHRLCQCYVL